MIKKTLPVLLAMFVTANAFASIDLSEFENKGSHMEIGRDEAQPQGDFLAPIEQDWASYLRQHAIKIGVGALSIGATAGTFFYLPKYVGGQDPRSPMAKIYFAIFKLLNIAVTAPQVVFVQGGEGPVQVVKEITVTAWQGLMNAAAKAFDYKRPAFSAVGTSYQKFFTAENWAKMVAYAENLKVTELDQ